jgi:hypothetical protein
VEYTKQQEQKLAEWKQNAPYYFQKHQLIDENRWNTIKSTIELFETLQQSHANAIIEVRQIQSLRAHCKVFIK